jgi:hypothetical protein
MAGLHGMFIRFIEGWRPGGDGSSVGWAETHRSE